MLGACLKSHSFAHKSFDMVFRNDFPFYGQLDQMDCGPTCLKMIASYYGQEIDIEKLRKESHSTREGVSMGGLIEAASTIGIDGMAVQVSWSEFSDDIPLPCIVHWHGKHFCARVSYAKKIVSLHIQPPQL